MYIFTEFGDKITASIPCGSAHVTADTARMLVSIEPRSNHCTGSPENKIFKSFESSQV